jgi:ubiquinone/menaquinone biosynthesis C-methylase UbiE
VADGFGRLAYLYAWLERAIYGDLLGRARRSCLDDLGEAEHILIVGEGDGRFLVSLLARQPRCRVTCLDSSAGMLRRAEQRVLAQLPGSHGRVTWRHEDALGATLPAAHYDAVVTRFFLDVFPKGSLETLIPDLSRSLRPGGRWLVADFAAPDALEPGWLRLYSRVLVGLMYTFFRVQTALSAGTLVPPQPFLRACGLEPVATRRFRGGFVYAQTWRKPAAGQHPS